MKKSLTLALALIALVVFTGLGVAQERRHAQGPPLVGTQTAIRCCECLGKAYTLDLSTGHAPWKVTPPSSSASSAFNTSPIAGVWMTIPGAGWIQPVSSPTPVNVPAGVYKYSVSFSIPKWIIPSSIKLEGKFAADNSAKVYLDTPGNTLVVCTGSSCFKAPDAPKSFSALNITGPTHTLVIEVTNDGNYSGLSVNATVTRQCAREGNLGNSRARVPTTRRTKAFCLANQHGGDTGEMKRRFSV
jgi:hypothetical protein